MIKQIIKKRRQKGSFLIEMAIVSWVLLYMLVGSFQMGMMLIRAIQAGEVCRNANVLEVRGIDLSQTQNQELLLRTGPSLGINTSGAWTPSSTGTGLIVLSKIYDVGPLMCSQGVTNYPTASCPNIGQYVIAMRINIGNSTTYGPSILGNPSSTPASNGDISDANICSVTGNVASSTATSLVTLTEDTYTWVAEVYADSKNFNIFPWFQAPTIYMRNFS
jgi:hypothetical protein